MKANFEHIRKQQKETWNKFSQGWKKWDDLTMDFLKPMTDEIVRMISPARDELVLDVASGTGEPGLTIADLLPDGKVVITDLSEGMLEVARENAARQGITNTETIVCDVCELPFADNTFDAISCRLGFMFFPDMSLAAREMLRVLKPGGKIATTVWGAPDKNFWATGALSIINKNMVLPKLPVGAPGIFRCAERGIVASLLSAAGFKDVTESEVYGKLNARTFDVYWEYMTDVVAGVVAALNAADDAKKAKIKLEVYKSVMDRYPSGELAIESYALAISGMK